MENVSSELELLELRKDGKISEDEYKQLLEAMRKSSVRNSQGRSKAVRKYHRWIIPIVSLIIVAAILLSLGMFFISTRGDIDLAIAQNGFTIRPNSEAGLYTLTVSILNRGSKTSPSFRVKYYRGDPANNHDESGKLHSGWHNAGPIKPGDGWNERTRPFALGEGEYEFYVILDTEELVGETDETNNSALLKVVIHEDKISEVK